MSFIDAVLFGCNLLTRLDLSFSDKNGIAKRNPGNRSHDCEDLSSVDKVASVDSDWSTTSLSTELSDLRLSATRHIFNVVH